MDKQEQIRVLAEALMILMDQPDGENQPNTKTFLQEQREKTINDLNSIGVDINTVRRIMERVDQVYGKCDKYIVTKPLHEEYDNLSKYEGQNRIPSKIMKENYNPNPDPNTDYPTW